MNIAHALIGLLLAGPGDGPAAQSQTRLEDTKAIQALTEAFVQAYNGGDAAAAAATFAEDAEVRDAEGAAVHGRESIAERFASVFEDNPGGTIAVKTSAIRFLGAEGAVEDGLATVTPGDGGPAETTPYTVLYVKQDGKWLQASVRDLAPAPKSAHERLEPLAWMVGDWVNESQQAVVATSCRWADNESFLLRGFTVKVEGKPVMSGTQRIGWDPLTKQIKSWVFDSEGGHGEGFWARSDDGWIVKATGVRPDGEIASSTQYITPIGRDRVKFSSLDRTLGGDALPDVDEFILVRKAPEPGK